MFYRTVLVGLLLLIPLAAQAQPATPIPSHADQAQQIIQMFVSGDFAGVYAQANAAVKAAVTADQLGQAWQGLLKQAGAFQSVTQISEDPNTHVVTVTLQFEKGAFNVLIGFDSDGQMSGLHFTPAGPTAFATPPYNQPDAYTETKVTVGDLKLPGLLTLPKGTGPFPAVVLIAGSGPSDMDETIGPNKPFRDLAWGLAAQGIASLRYDKRTYAAAASLDLPHFTVKEEYVDDSVAAVELLRQTSGIDPARVFILGHSEGGYIAPRIAKADPNIAGVILAAGAATSLRQAALRQLEYISSLSAGTPEPTQAAVIAEMMTEVKKIDTLTADSPADQPVFHAWPAYWLDLRGYDPAALEASLPQPVLVVQGGRDYQVTVADDLPLWQKALADHPDVTFKTYPDLNHLFMTGTGMATPAEYNQPGHVAQAVIDDIAAWVKAH